MLIRRHIDIPKGSRCCERHTVNGFFISWSIFGLTAYKNDHRLFDGHDIVDIVKNFQAILYSNKCIDFDNCFSLSDIDYKTLTGFTREQHDRILSYIPPTTLKNSINRSPRCALACLLMKLKLGASNSVLAIMLGIDNKRKVSDIIHSARLALWKYFVPSFLGLKHISRHEVIRNHTSSIAIRLLTENRKSLYFSPRRHLSIYTGTVDLLHLFDF